MHSRLAGAMRPWYAVGVVGLLAVLGVMPARALAEFSAGQFPVVGVALQGEAPAPPAEPEEPAGLFGTRLLAGWENNLALGFTGKSGNTDSLDLYGKYSGDYDDDERRWRVRAAYFYGLAESNRTKNEGFANVRRDWLLSANPAFVWAEGRTDYNEFKSWRTRLGAFAGVGYEFYKTDALTLLGRVGGGGSYELGDVQEFIPEALISAEATWKLAENQTITFLNTLFPDLDDQGEFRNFTEAAWTITVDAARGLSLKLGLQNQYDSFTEDDSQHNDLTYFAALVLDF